MAKISLSSKKDNPKGYKTSTSKTMKESGAKYSTTNRSGVTSYYSSGKDVDNGIAPIKQTLNGTTLPTAITSESLQTNPAINVGKPVVTDPGDMMKGNYGLQSQRDGLTYTGSQFVYDPSKSEAVNAVAESNSRGEAFLQQALAQIGTPVNKEKEFNRLEKQSGIRDYEQKVNDYTSQLNSITASSQAEQLKLEGQGRGQTEGFVGGEQARINREAAIAALPVQAQLAAAQGSLQFAESRLNRLWAIRSSDIDAQYNHRANVVNKVLEFANASESRLLNARLSDIADKKATEKDNLNQIREWSKMALQSGQNELISQFATLDPASENFASEFGAIQSQVQDTTSALQRESLRASIASSNRANQASAKRDTQVVDGKLIDMQTGEVISGLGGTGGSPLALAQTKGNIDLITGLTSNRKLNSAVGPNAFARASFTNLITGGKSDVIATIEQLRSQLTLDSLINAKAKGATFGALSEGELKVLSQSASQLGTWAIKDPQGNVKGYKTSESSFKKEMDKINNFARLDYLLKGGTPTEIGVQVQADGTYWVRNSDGTYTELK